MLIAKYWLWYVIVFFDVLAAFIINNVDPHFLPHPGTEYTQSINDFCCCILRNLSSNWWWTFITEVLASWISKIEWNTLPGSFWQWASTECEWFLILWVRQLKCNLVNVRHNHGIGHLHRLKGNLHGPCPIMKVSVNRLSTSFVLTSLLIRARCGRYCYYTKFSPFTLTDQLIET